MSKTIITVLSLFTLLALSGCNTVKGVGQDLQAAGEKIDDAGKKT